MGSKFTGDYALSIENTKRRGARLQVNLRGTVRAFLYADGFEFTTPKRIDATSMAKWNP